MFKYPGSTRTLTATPYTIVPTDSGTLLVAKSGATQTIALPTPTADFTDVRISVYQPNAQTLTFTATTGKMVTPGSAADTTYSFTGGIGTFVNLLCNGTVWFVMGVAFPGNLVIGSGTSLTTLTASTNTTLTDNVISIDGYIAPVGLGVPGTSVRTYKYAVVRPDDASLALAWTGAVVYGTKTGGALTLTLPAAAAAWNGFHVKIIQTTNNNLVVTGVADTLVTRGDATATSVTFSTESQKIGAAVEVFCDGSKWYATNISDCQMDVA